MPFYFNIYYIYINIINIENIKIHKLITNFNYLESEIIYNERN